MMNGEGIRISGAARVPGHDEAHSCARFRATELSTLPRCGCAQCWLSELTLLRALCVVVGVLCSGNLPVRLSATSLHGTRKASAAFAHCLHQLNTTNSTPTLPP